MSEDRGALRRAVLVNENLGGHATMHQGIRWALREHPDVESEFIDVPRARFLRRLVGARVPGLAGLDADLQPLRAQLAASAWVWHRLRRRGIGDGEVLHLYSENIALLSESQLRRHPSVVSTERVGEAVCLSARLSGADTTDASSSAAELLDRTEGLCGRDSGGRAIRVGPRSLRADGHVDDDRLRLIPFGVIVPDDIARHDGDGAPQITFVASDMKRKGGWRLLRVFRERLRDQCVLNLVTREAVPPEPGVRVFSDVRPNDGKLSELLAGSAALAFPSEMDTFGYAALEAMSMGVPVVGLRLHALPELVEDGVTGLLVAADDDAGFALALERLVSDPALRVRMGQAARARVRKHFDARLTTARLLDVLEEARRRHPGCHAHGASRADTR